MKRFLPMLVVGLVLGSALGVMIGQLIQSTREVAALECARTSNGTDAAIAECYATHKLPIPEDF